MEYKLRTLFIEFSQIKDSKWHIIKLFSWQCRSGLKWIQWIDKEKLVSNTCVLTQPQMKSTFNIPCNVLGKMKTFRRWTKSY